jgi:hypothetical protein
MVAVWIIYQSIFISFVLCGNLLSLVEYAMEDLGHYLTHVPPPPIFPHRAFRSPSISEFDEIINDDHSWRFYHDLLPFMEGVFLDLIDSYWYDVYEPFNSMLSSKSFLERANRQILGQAFQKALNKYKMDHFRAMLHHPLFLEKVNSQLLGDIFVSLIDRRMDHFQAMLSSPFFLEKVTKETMDKVFELALDSDQLDYLKLLLDNEQFLQKVDIKIIRKAGPRCIWKGKWRFYWALRHSSEFVRRIVDG